MQFHCTKMLFSWANKYSIEPKYKIYVIRYRFLSFAKSTSNNLINKYSQQLLDSAKKSTMDAVKTASKRAIQETAEATVDLICNKIADKITKNDDANSEIGVPKKIHISRRKTTNYWWIKVSITI